MKRLILGLVIGLLLVQSAYAETMTPVQLPSGEKGIGFDDLVWASHLNKILIPGGRTGTLFLIDAGSHQLTSITGFSQKETYRGGHEDGITSVDEGEGFLFITDRSTKMVYVVDPKIRKVISSAKLSASPDYIRYVAGTHEVWITEPDEEKIEIFMWNLNKKKLIQTGFCEVPGGPESLVISTARAVAYTHLWAGKTVAIDLKNRKPRSQWVNGCKGSRGIALDDHNGFLFAAGSEGLITVIDVRNGAILSKLKVGAGIDIIAYNPYLRRLYIPSEESRALFIVKVSEAGELFLQKKLQTLIKSHCVVTDSIGNVWIADAGHGQLLLYQDH